MPAKQDGMNYTAGMERTWAQRAVYSALHVVARVLGVLAYRIRCQGHEFEPQSGGVLVCPNHQSFLDPVLVGLTLSRRLNFLARDTLFRVPILGPLIRFLDAIPIDLRGSGLGGLKETLKRLKGGEMVLIFPEGTRTSDGEVQSLKPGFCSIARRSKVPLLPIGIDGAFQAWPRTAKLPTLGRIAIVVGEPISPELLATLTDEQLIAELALRIADCHQRARELRG